MKKVGLYFTLAVATIASLFAAKKADAQISTEQAYPIDSALANTYLTSPVVHDYSVHNTPSGPVQTWDAGSGLYTPIPGYFVGWSHTDKVDPSTAQAIDGMEGQSYKTFDLEQMVDTSAYRDSLETWLSSIGIPVGITSYENIEKRLFPNPINSNTRLQADIPAGEEYKLVISDMTGRVVGKYEGKTDENGLNIKTNLNAFLPKGTYIFSLYTDKGGFSMKGVKQ